MCKHQLQVDAEKVYGAECRKFWKDFTSKQNEAFKTLDASRKLAFEIYKARMAEIEAM